MAFDAAKAPRAGDTVQGTRAIGSGVAVEVLGLAAFAYALFLVFFKIFHGQPLQGWTTTMVVLAFFSGVQLLCLGILGEYLWRALDAARGRKRFLVRERTGTSETGDTRR